MPDNSTQTPVTPDLIFNNNKVMNLINFRKFVSEIT